MLTPFADESSSLEINGLTVENRLDRVSIFGSADITRDQVGLAAARELCELASLIVADLESLQAAGRLPAQVEVEQPETVENPFN
ncbi:hypothetical protein [Geomonas subterranea]|uniref:hypothetical protein n=1 Tax=Geomonas subterranea TaxID=2847989 RepID=UPI001CD77FBC|nr:hypothetical protein [Geomonas fuzhouensis]